MTDYTIAFLHILADHAAIAIENARDVARIQQLSITDDCTGLYNARHLYDVLGRELEHCTSKDLPVSLAFLDLDRFKLVNDVHGHLVGSELLAHTGRAPAGTGSRSAASAIFASATVATSSSSCCLKPEPKTR